MTEPRRAVILGSAACINEDVAALGEWGRGAIVIAINDAAACAAGRIDHLATWHPEKADEWREKRRARGGNVDFKTWAMNADTPGPLSESLAPWKNEHGTSALLAVGVALEVLGCDEVALCGCPLDSQPRFFEQTEWCPPELNSGQHHAAWTRMFPKMQGRVYSMSGWTKDLLGAPPGVEVPELPPVMVAVPTPMWMWSDSVTSIVAMWNRCPPASPLQFVGNATTIAKKRNAAVEMFLKSDAEALLFIDSDMVPRPDLYARLARHNKDVVAALCFCRTPPYRIAAMPLNPDPSEHGLVEAMWVGTGCVLIQRHVLEAMPEPWFVANAEDTGEDVAFSLAAREAGFRVYVDMDSEAGHITAHAVDSTFSGQWRQRNPDGT